jgi:GTP cyclohydrolase I
VHRRANFLEWSKRIVRVVAEVKEQKLDSKHTAVVLSANRLALVFRGIGNRRT